MCGFCGFIDISPNKEDLLRPMMEPIIHRGPDGENIYTDDYISMGACYLNTSSKPLIEPIKNSDERYILHFTGNIYNQLDIRSTLKSKGYEFEDNNNNSSDIIIPLYKEYGSGMLSHLRGVFSFVIWDTKESTLFGAKDFFGTKPLYYYHKDGLFAYASEVKSLLKHKNISKILNEQALETYLTFQYSAMSETFFKDIFRVPPAHFFIFKDGKLDIKRYWEPIFEEKQDSLNNYVDKIDEAMKESIRLHETADIEVGSFLSSGVDSSYVASCFSGTKTFTVGFNNENYNEIDYAKSLSDSLGVNNINRIISPDEYWSVLPKLQYYMDEPLADPAAVALYFVSQLASEHVKVVLSGEGADEFFGGYNIYKEPLDIAGYQKLPKGLRKALASIARSIPFSFKGKNFLIRASKDIEERFIGNAYMFTPKERSQLLKKTYGAPDPQDLTAPFYNKVQDKNDVTKMQYLDIHMWLTGDILLKADRMSMANSIDVRMPFLDKEVFNVARELPLEYKVNKQNTKYALRLAAKRNLPESVANKKKLGFPVPTRVWLRQEKYYNIVHETFNSNIAAKYFNTDILTKFLDDHYNNKKDNSRKIWTVYMFLLWYEEYFVKL